MQGMIFCAGLGSRLKPFTNKQPKAMVKLAGKPFLYHIIKKFERLGVSQIVVNVHHFAEQIIAFIKQSDFKTSIAISHEKEILLDTGGGLKKAHTLFHPSEPIIIHNVDVMTNIDLSEMINQHKRNRALATLAIRKRYSSRQLLFSDDLVLKGWQNNKTNEQILVGKYTDLKAYGFSGIHIVSPQLIEMLPNTEGAFPIIPQYLELAKSHLIQGYLHDDDVWLDLGTPERLQQAEEIIKQNPSLL